MGNRDAMMDAHVPKLLAVNRRTRTQTFKSKALTWKETASFNHTCLLTISWSIQGLPYFQHDIYHTQCFNTAVVSLFHLHFARLRQMRSALNIFFSLLNTFVTLSQFQLQFSFFYLAWPGCTQSAMWSPIWCCPTALTVPRCIPINFYFTLNNFPPFRLSLSVASFLHPCPSSLPQTLNFQCISFCLFPKYMALKFALLNLSIFIFLDFLRSCISFWIIFHSFSVLMIHTNVCHDWISTAYSYFYAKLFNENVKKDWWKDWFFLPCYTFSSLLPLQNYSVFSPSCNCPLSITPVLISHLFCPLIIFPSIRFQKSRKSSACSYPENQLVL